MAKNITENVIKLIGLDNHLNQIPNIKGLRMGSG